MDVIDLEWTPLKGAKAYRLTVTDANSGETLARSGSLTEPQYALEPSIANGREILAKLEVLGEGAEESEWKEAGPPARLPLPDPGGRATTLRWEGISPVHRLVIADQTAGRTVFKQPVLGTSFPYTPSPAERGHELVMRVHGRRDGDWDEGTEWRPLPLSILLGDRRDPPPPIEPGQEPAVLLAFTIDTEGWIVRQNDPDPAKTIDELVFGDFGNSEQNGIGLHMDLLEHFGFRGCFFVDVLFEYQYGQEALERTIEAIAGRGHEIQLHLHDEHLRRAEDPALRALAGDLLRKDRDSFRRLFELSVELFERRTGRPPLAYRAGGYRITDDHFPVLEEFGIQIDSSVNAYWNSRVSEWMKTRTQPYWVGEVLELPPTWTLLRDDRSAPETRSFAPNATAGDPVSGMPASTTGVPRVATYVSHSCELMRVIRDLSPEAMAAYERTLRSAVPAEIADRVMHELGENPRLIDGRVDDELVFRVAGILRRIADREDARCVTLTELRDLSAGFPRERRREPVDPVPVIDRPHRASTVTGTRVYSEGLLERLTSSDGDDPFPGRSADEAITSLVNADIAWRDSEVALIAERSPAVSAWLERRGVARVAHFEQPEPEAAGEFDVVIWPAGFERCPPTELRGRLDAAAAMLRDDGALLLRVRTLGLASPLERNGHPPLAELLFPSYGAADVTAWDATTFSAWFANQGFGAVAEHRVPRSGIELAELERFADKLGAIPGSELHVDAVDFTLRRSGPEPVEEPSGNGPEPATRGEAARLLDRFHVVAPGDDVLEIAVPGGEPLEPPAADDVVFNTAGPESLLSPELEAESNDVIVCSETLEEINLERLEEACASLYQVLRPGGQLLLRIAEEAAGPATVTTILVGLLRVGFELLAADRSGAALDCRLVRPLELQDITRFSGLPA